MAVLSLDTTHPLHDLIDARAYLDMVIRRRQGEQVDQRIAEGIIGTPLSLKKGAPENKLAHLTREAEESKQEGLPFDATPTTASVMSPDDLAAAQAAAAAAVAKAAEPAPAEKPKRERKKPEVVKTVTVDEVRALMVSLSSKGADEQQRQRSILTSMGYEKLSQVPPEKLVDLMAKIKGE